MSTKIMGRLPKMRVIALVALAIVSTQLTGFATTTGDQASKQPTKKETLEEKWGIQVGAIRLTGADLMLDFRYRVKDPQKAIPILKRGKEVYLIDQATGKKLPVPTTKVGPMRATTVEPKAGRQYAILFSNVNKMVKKGSKVTVVIGDFRAENLTVE